MYRTADATLVRATAHDVGLELPPWPDLDGGTTEDVERWRNWLAQVWAREGIAEAIEVASPALASRIRAVCDGSVDRPRQVRRVLVSVVRYLLRMQHRATPFGLFAGVAPARFGPRLTMRWGEDHQAWARADAVWLSEVVMALEACPELLHRLPVVADPTCFVRGGKLVVPCQQPPHNRPDGPAEISVRHTRAVETVVRAARSPVPVSELAGQLADAYPDTPAEAIDRLLVELVACRVLLTSLRPPMTVTDALGHVVSELTAVDAVSITEVEPSVRQLSDIHKALAAHNHATLPATRAGVRASASRQMTALTSVVEQPLAVDLRIDSDLVLPRQVAREAEKALEAMARLTPFPSGAPAWQDYHARFLERYGTGALVPVRELVDPDVGLGYPAGYRGSRLDRPPQHLTAQDEQLITLAQRAAIEDTREVALDDRGIADLATGEAVQPPAHVELCFHIQAPTRAALAGGAFDVVVAGLSSAAGTTTGRFLNVLDASHRHRMASAYATLPTLDAGALPAQVSSPPLRVRTENVSRAPAVLPHVIHLAEHGHTTGALPLDDLAVGGDAQRLFLVSLSQRRRVEPALLNAVQLSNLTHPLARFLCEIPRARAAALIPFSWGAASRMPFLPRIRYGRTVLSPACWRLDAADLAPRGAPLAEWADNLAAKRKQFRLPDAVHLGADDQRLRLNLDEKSHLQLLRAELDRTGQATVHEAPGPTAYGWFDGRAHEITMALAATGKPALLPAARREHPTIAIGLHHGQLPGNSTWAFVKLYGHPDRVPDLLTTYLPALFDDWDSPPEWWYVRYRDPEPHLRLRLRLPHPNAFGETAQRVGSWAAQLRDLGLIGRVQWDTYFPETGRYGTGPTMTAAETVFAADSAAAVTQLTHTAGTTLHPAVTAASFVDLAAAFTGSATAGTRWLVDHITRPSGPAPDRRIHDQAIHLANPHDDFAALRTLPGGGEIADNWARRRGALASYHASLETGGGTDPDSVLTSLLHMHHIRTAGIDDGCERACRGLARSAAVSWTARREGGHR